MIGDTYAAAGTRSNRNGMGETTLTGGNKKLREHINNPNICSIQKDTPEKSLCMIPERFAIRMIDNGWILRNKIIWYKPNCMPSSAKDRFTVDWEYVYFFTKSQKYYFETQYEPHLTAVYDPTGFNRAANSWRKQHMKHQANKDHHIQSGGHEKQFINPANPLGRIKRAVWRISTKPFSGAHFAVFPPDLVEPMLKAGCPEFICKKCGFMRKLEYEETKHNTHSYRFGGNKAEGYGNPTYSGNEWEPVIRTPKSAYNGKWGKEDEKTSGWQALSNLKRMREITGQNRPDWNFGKELVMTSCNCNEGFHPGVVLDCFFGAGTVGLVALQQNKDFIGIELNPDYIKIAEQRLAPLIEQQKLPL